MCIRDRGERRAAYEDSVFAVDDARLRRRGRSAIVGRRVDAYGNVTEDDTVYARAARSDQAIAEAEARREKLRDAAQAVLLEINKAEAIRRARHLRALYLESYPEPAPPQPTLLARIGDAVRGT